MNKNIQEHLRNKVIENMIIPSYEEELTYAIRARKFWMNVSPICFLLSTVMMSASTLLAFANGDLLCSNLNVNLTYITGCIGVSAIMLKEFGSYANKQEHIRTLEVNGILDSIGVNVKLRDIKFVGKYRKHINDDIAENNVETNDIELEPDVNEQSKFHLDKDVENQ